MPPQPKTHSSGGKILPGEILLDDPQASYRQEDDILIIDETTETLTKEAYEEMNQRSQET